MLLTLTVVVGNMTIEIFENEPQTMVIIDGTKPKKFNDLPSEFRDLVVGAIRVNRKYGS